MERRSGWLLATYVGIQLAIPALLVLVRWTIAGGACLPFGWQMYACV
jgi:hypothetical protein